MFSGAAADGRLEELVLGGRVFVDPDDALLLEGPQRGAAAADLPMVLVEELSHLCDRAVPIVGDDLTKEQGPVGADSLVQELLILDPF